MDTQTRHALKQDKFVSVTASGLEWIGEHRSNFVAWLVGFVLAAGLVVAGIFVYQKREAAANQLLGQAMDIYETPLAQPNQPAEPGQKTYATAAERAKAAYPLFRQTADQYGWLTPVSYTHLSLSRTRTHCARSGISSCRSFSTARQ